jgi:uncharacterized protein DUF4157
MNKTPVAQQGKMTSVLPPAQGILQRQCACGTHTMGGGQCADCAKKTGLLQRKLTIGASNDPLEQEADRIAEQVLAAPAHSAMSGTPPRIQRFTGHSTGENGTAPASVDLVLASSGRPLDPALQQDMGQRFGHDFSTVRVHSDAAAEQSARDVNAHAYTVGHNIVFGGGRFAPGTNEGRRLIAHELTHVVQQRATDGNLLTAAPPMLSRQPAGSPTIQEQLERAAEAFATARLNGLAAEPGPPALFAQPGCPANFCQPFARTASAVANLAWAGPLILAGIARKVNSRVVPLWASYMTGGAAPRSLTGDFGTDFSASPTTANTTDFLLGELRSDIEANQTTLMGGLPVVVVDFTPRLSAALTAINTPGDPNQMNFDVIGDIAGNVAGGIGTDQLSSPIGARPSPFNDDRAARITATLTRTLAGPLTVAPTIDFSIHDTIDLCPGNCGAPTEQVATVPLSRFEATGLVGDVPFTIDFPAPLAKLTPFTVAPPLAPPSPVPGSVTASSLLIRSTTTTASARLGSYPRGALITILCETMGEMVDGNPKWDRTDRGFVSDRYVSRSVPMLPPAC